MSALREELAAVARQRAERNARVAAVLRDHETYWHDPSHRYLCATCPADYWQRDDDDTDGDGQAPHQAEMLGAAGLLR